MSAVWATVARVESSRVWLRIEDQGGGCGRCHEPGGCGSVKLSHLFKTSNDLVELAAVPGVCSGERVLLQIAEGAPLRAALTSYGLPVTAMLLCALFALALSPFASGDANALVGAGLGLLFGVLGGRALMRSRRWRRAMAISLRRGKDFEDVSRCAHPR